MNPAREPVAEPEKVVIRVPPKGRRSPVDWVLHSVQGVVLGPIYGLRAALSGLPGWAFSGRSFWLMPSPWR